MPDHSAESHVERVAAWGLPRLVYAAAHDCEPWDVDNTDGGYADVAHLLAEEEAAILAPLVQAAGLSDEAGFVDVLEWITARSGGGRRPEVSAYTDQWEATFESFKANGVEAEEAALLASWDTRHWWSDSDDHALAQLDPWLPPELRQRGRSAR